MDEVERHDPLPQPIEKWAFVRMWHPRVGVQVSIPIPGTGITVDQAKSLLEAVDNLAVAGWVANAPGLEEGEQREEIGWVCRLDHEKGDEVTPTVLLYAANDQLTWSFLRKYLNTEDEVKAFEEAAGIRLDQLPVYPGNDHPQRGSSRKTDQYIVKLAKQLGLIWKHNPRYKDPPAGDDTRSVAEKRKRDFVRWASQKPTQPAQPANSQPAQQTPQSGKSWSTSTKEERIFAIMSMKDFKKLQDIRGFAMDKIHDPQDKGDYLMAVRNRAFQLFQLSLAEATSEETIRDIIDAAAGGNYGDMTPEHMRDLEMVAKNTRMCWAPKK